MSVQFGILKIAKFVQLSRKWLFSKIIQICEFAGHVFIFMIAASGRVCKDSNFSLISVVQGMISCTSTYTPVQPF